MTLEELADLMPIEIKVRYNPGNHKWMADLDGAEIKGNGVLCGACGYGVTPYEALRDYVEKIKGKILVFDAYSDQRRECGVPETVVF